MTKQHEPPEDQMRDEKLSLPYSTMPKLGPKWNDPASPPHAEPVGQPVAWMYENEVLGKRVFHTWRLLDHAAGWTETPLYASPSAQPIATSAQFAPPPMSSDDRCRRCNTKMRLTTRTFLSCECGWTQERVDQSQYAAQPIAPPREKEPWWRCPVCGINNRPDEDVCPCGRGWLGPAALKRAEE